MSGALVHRSLRGGPAGSAPYEATGTVSEWGEWTERKFSKSGSYLVPGALEPITIDLERDLGCYEEPNVWMQHMVRTKTGRESR